VLDRPHPASILLGFLLGIGFALPVGFGVAGVLHPATVVAVVAVLGLVLAALLAIFAD
jgi:amino acid transporter